MDRQRVARRLQQLAARQHGVVGVAQLYELGLSGDWLRRAERKGWMHRVHRGVYAVGHARLTQRGMWMAGVLAAGGTAVLSHGSAAALWRIAPLGTSPVHVTVLTPGGRGHAGLVLHRRPSLTRRDMTSRHRIPVVSPELTLIDIACFLSERDLERAVDEAQRLGRTRLNRLNDALSRHRGRRGVVPLKAALGSHVLGSTVTRSELEERFLTMCRERGVPLPEVNADVGDYVADMLWRGERLLVELDGRATHGTPAAFQRDRDRDSTLTAMGYTTLRFTWWDVTQRPAVVTDRIRRTLARLPRATR